MSKILISLVPQFGSLVYDEDPSFDVPCFGFPSQETESTTIVATVNAAVLSCSVALSPVGSWVDVDQPQF